MLRLLKTTTEHFVSFALNCVLYRGRGIREKNLTACRLNDEKKDRTKSDFTANTNEWNKIAAYVSIVDTVFLVDANLFVIILRRATRNFLHTNRHGETVILNTPIRRNYYGLYCGQTFADEYIIYIMHKRPVGSFLARYVIWIAKSSGAQSS